MGKLLFAAVAIGALMVGLGSRASGLHLLGVWTERIPQPPGRRAMDIPYDGYYGCQLEQPRLGFRPSDLFASSTGSGFRDHVR